MNMTPKELNRLFYLCGAIRDEVITPVEFEELEKLLQANPEAQDVYLDYVYLCTDLCKLQAAVEGTPQENKQNFIDEEYTPTLTLESLRVLGDYERNAETLIVPEPDTNDDNIIIRKIPVQKSDRPIPKFSIITFITSLAALLVMVFYVLQNPRSSLEVATITHTANATWSSPLPLETGIRLAVTSERVQLQEGKIEIVTDKDVKVVLEAPAEFQFTSLEEVTLQYGRLFAYVPQKGSGFIVKTNNSKIIDLGTKFGVFADMRGDTELHVFKGKTMLIAGSQDEDKQTVKAVSGQAFKVGPDDSKIASININHKLFTQYINSENKQIQLANIVGGGNGYGRLNKDRGIQWNGLPANSKTDLVRKLSTEFPSEYVPVNSNPLIDGIFIPNCAGEEPVTLTSDVATLNLDDFIRSDTNGQITLVMVHETDDPHASHWFASKESPSITPDEYPTLIFPNAAAQGKPGPIYRNTSYNNGADAYVSNDTLRSPSSSLGKTPRMACRFYQNNRARMIYLKFDISDLQGDLSNAVLSLHLLAGNRDRSFHVYGLKDRSDETWNEDSINYHTAPGLLPAEIGNYTLNEKSFDFLGTFHVVDNRILTDPIPVTADGKYRWNAPKTICQSDHAISNVGKYISQNDSTQPLSLGGLPCGTDQTPCIFIHANGGITFDLDAIRAAHGPVTFESFTASCGISGSVIDIVNNDIKRTMYPCASFYVLLDGKEAFSSIDMSPEDAPQSINVRLKPENHYLTLVTTQGTDNSIKNDVGIFMKPTLNIK